jgi:hypothetical protein
VDARADATGPVFLLAGMTTAGANQLFNAVIVRQQGNATNVYAQASGIPEGLGLYFDDAARPCTLVSTATTSYAQCLGGAKQPTGLMAVAQANQNGTSSRMASSRAADGTTVFYTFSPFAAIDTVDLSGGKFTLSETNENSISFPGAGATAGGVVYACVIGSDDALGLADGDILTRTHDGMSYKDCRMASDGTNVFIVGVADTTAVYVTLRPVIDPGAPAPKLAPVPISVDVSQPFDVVVFGGKPSLVQVGADGAANVSAIAADGSLGTPRVLATGASALEGPAAIGPDRGLHIVVSTGGTLTYVKRCP